MRYEPMDAADVQEAVNRLSWIDFKIAFGLEESKTHQEIADELGLSRQAVTARVRKFAKIFG